MDASKVIIDDRETKYIGLYNHYKGLILQGAMKSGDKLPSVRACSHLFSLSRTTVESAYYLLAAEGYVISREKSGFYVCGTDSLKKSQSESLKSELTDSAKIKYDLVSSSADGESFNFSLWRRYVKSALRQTERLLSYGEAQGEYELREAVCGYINKQRGVICSPEQIVIAAGTQSLLGILCAVTKDRNSVALIGSDFEQGRAVFEDYGKAVFTPQSFEEESHSSGVILYVSPSNINSWGGVLKTQQRLELLSAARKNGCLVIEDDYDSEFRYYSRPAPSLQSLDKDGRVIYIGTFSKLLLPSIRISFMVLTPSLAEEYRKRAKLYNQTASKAEQIALCQYIRDGKLASQIRKQRKRYIARTELVCRRAEEILPKTIELSECHASYLVRIRVKTPLSAEETARRAEENGVKLKPIRKSGEKAELLMSIAGFDEKDCDDMLERLKKSWIDKK